MNKSLIITFSLLVLFSILSYAETPENKPEVESGMSFWEEFTGNWKGNGWRLSESGEKIDLKHAYTVQLKLNKTLLLLENKTTIHGEVHHESFVVITYDKSARNFPIRIHSTISPPGDRIGVIEDGAFIYFMQENLRFSMTINEKGQIYESGEVNMGGQWVPFFEMVSVKQD